jgi:hypothetical protein
MARCRLKNSISSARSAPTNAVSEANLISSIPDLSGGLPKRASELACQLFARYRAVSAGHAEPFRTIVVVGAGASHAACGLPLGKALAETVMQRVQARGISKDLIEKELSRLEQVNRMRPKDFETQLLALSKYDSATVLKVLCEQCDVAHYPSRTYEIIAHLMKHGFLDAVINFNFDELLDQAIDEEVGGDRYTRIVRDGDWSHKLRADGGRLGWRFDRPLYIKPHGTVSDPESLRFTREAYFALPPDTARLLTVLISGAPASRFLNAAADDKPTRPRPVCLLVLGHALESFEFNELFRKCPAQSRLFTVAFRKERRTAAQKEWPPRMRRIAKKGAIHIEKEDGALDELMLRLWAAIERESNGEASAGRPWMTVRGIARHELVSALFAPFRPGILMRRDFSNLTSEQRQAMREYFHDRFVIEIMLAIAKARGFVDLRELHRGRAGRFYNLQSRISPRDCMPVSHYLKEFGMERRDSSGDSYWHSTVPRDDADTDPGAVGEGIPQRLTLNSQEFVEYTRSKLISACRTQLTKHRLKNADKLGDVQIQRMLGAMFDGGEVEIVPERSAHFQFRFEDARAIRTLAEMHYETQRLLEQPWKLLLCVAESAEWLLEDQVVGHISSRGKTVGAIVADTVVDKKLDGMPNVKVERLPWHLHNRHMTIRLVRNLNGELDADRAIYFERRYRSTLISPVVLRAKADLETAMNDFTVYWLKALRHKEGLSEVISYSPARLKQEKETMLKELLKVNSNRSSTLAIL